MILKYITEVIGLIMMAMGTFLFWDGIDHIRWYRKHAKTSLWKSDDRMLLLWSFALGIALCMIGILEFLAIRIW